MTAGRLSLPTLGIAAAAAAALLLQLLHLAGRPLWLDESWSRWMAEQDWKMLWESARRFDTHPPVYYSLLKLWLPLAPPTPLGMRLLSVLAGLAILAAGWVCARRIRLLARERWAPPLLVAMVALSPPVIIAARQARPYALFALAFALALAAALGLARAPVERRARTSLWLSYFLGLELLLWLHGLGILFAAALGGGLFLALSLHGRLRRELVPFVAVHAFAALAWLPCLLMILEQRRGWTQTWLRFSWSDVPSGLAAGLAAPGAAGLLVLLIAALGATALLRFREERPAAILLLSAAVLPALFTITISAVSSPVFLPRTLVPSVLPLLLLAAAGLASLKAAGIRWAAAAVTLAVLAVTSYATVTRPPEERWTLLSAWLDGRVGPREEVWLLPNELVLPLRYGASGDPGFPVRGIPAEFPAPNHRGPRYSGTIAVPGMSGTDAARLVRDARRRGLAGVWIVHRFPWLFDPESNLRQAFATAPVAASAEFAPLLVEHYRLEPAIPPPG